MAEPEIRSSARRHGVSEERMLYVVRTCPMPLDHPADNDQGMYLGPDQRGVPLEVPAFEDDNGQLVIIHAMRLRPSYRAAYEEVMRWL